LIHDRDKKFAPQADRVFLSQDARVILTPLMAPRANAHAERWIGSCRRECLDRMLIVNRRHLQAVIDEYCLHYNGERPHRSRSLRPPACPSDRVQATDGQIERTTRLGGLLSDYRRVPQARDVIFEPNTISTVNPGYTWRVTISYKAQDKAPKKVWYGLEIRYRPSGIIPDWMAQLPVSPLAIVWLIIWIGVVAPLLLTHRLDFLLVRVTPLLRLPNFLRRKRT